MSLLTRRAWIAKVLKVFVGMGLFRFSFTVKPSRASIEIASLPKETPSIGDTFANEVMTFTAGFLFF